MSEANNFEPTLDSWLQYNEQWWGYWLGTTQQATSIASEQFFNNPFGPMGDLLNCGLKVQSEWLRGYAKNLERGLGDALPLNAWTEQNTIAVKMWIDAQRRTWNILISAIEMMGPMNAADQDSDHIDKTCQDFRSITEKTLEMQRDLLSYWLPDSESAEPDTARQEAMMPQLDGDVRQAKSAA